MPQQIIEIPGVGPVEFPDSMSDADITIAARRLHDEAQAKSGARTASAPPAPSRDAQLAQLRADFARGEAQDARRLQATRESVGPAALPILGSLLGGAAGMAVAGPPGAALVGRIGAGVAGMLGAGLGSSAGQAAQAVLQGRAPGGAELMRAGVEGAIGQAAGPAIGKALDASGRAAGRALVRASVRPPAWVRKSFGGYKDIADTIIDEGVYSARSAGKAVQRASEDTRAALVAAAPTPTPIQPSELIDDLANVEQKMRLRGRLGKPDQTDALLERLQSMSDANPGGITLMDAQALKSAAQEDAYHAYRAMENGAPQTFAGETDAAIARGLKNAIERRAPVQALNARTQRLMGADYAMQNAQERSQTLSNMLGLLSAAGGAMSGNTETGLAGALAIQGLSSPRIGALAAILAGRGGRALNQPDLFKAAVMSALMASH